MPLDMEESVPHLTGKTALITASTAGLGRGISEGLAEACCIDVAHVAAMVVFLCGPASGDNGAMLRMEGGWPAT